MSAFDFTPYVQPLVDAFFCMLKNVWCWLMSTLLTWALNGSSIASAVFPKLPAIVPPAWWRQMYAVIDLYWPATEMFLLCAGYGLWLCTFLAVRLVKNSIPTMA